MITTTEDVKSNKKMCLGQPTLVPYKPFEGIVKFCGPRASRDERIQQEHHNAGHALWYLHMAAHAVINGTANRTTGQKTKRVVAHLSCLREFIPSSDRRFTSIATRLLDNLKASQPDGLEKWLHFLYSNWHLIRSFAERYGDRETCFPQDYYQKISNLLNGNYYFKLWWWRLIIEKIWRSFCIRLKDKNRRGNG